MIVDSGWKIEKSTMWQEFPAFGQAVMKKHVQERHKANESDEARRAEARMREVELARKAERGMLPLRNKKI